MGSIHVNGDLTSLKKQLIKLRNTALNRAADGYPIFMHDENWRYSAVEDDGACPTCISMHGEIFRGDYIPNDFPNYQAVSVMSVRVHYGTIYHPPGSCRCTAEWINSHEVVVQRFHSELLDVVGGG